mmetsp:Transcript_108306/g.209673  ORF Transcript_108306/g.209673 Transcript_108306/m.209673 type:complete len:207 (-) Transcript_108306:7-627(-)
MGGVACCRNTDPDGAAVLICQSDSCQGDPTLVGRGADLSGSGPLLNHMLLQAARDNDVKAVSDMLSKRAHVESRLPFRMTTSVSRPDFERPQCEGLTPLMYAAQNSSQHCCQVLLAARADLEAGDEDNMQPLHFAAGSGCIDTCKLLLDARADPSVSDHAGNTALEHVPAFAMVTRKECENWRQLLAQREQPNDGTPSKSSEASQA